ncbi:MAG: 4-hydroxy-3-methylbut-2-enyl diphosphate reductase [Lentisphaeria bacterium]
MNFFHDPDVDQGQVQNGRLQAGRWTLRVPRLLGFCGGVVSAVKTVQETIRNNPDKKICILGEIIHNDTVNDYFRRSGVVLMDEAKAAYALERLKKGDIVIIPAFGLEQALDARVRALSPEIQVIDTTCPKVKHIWDRLDQLAPEKRTIVIFGKPSHPETRATLSRSLRSDNAAILVPDIAHADKLAAAIRSKDLMTYYPPPLVRHPELVTLNKMALVNQTTMLYNETKKVETILRRAEDELGGSLVNSDTVCRATQRRQDAAREVCSDNCDLILVIGGFSSSNTTQLYRVACNAAPTYFIRDADSLQEKAIYHYVPAEKKVVETAPWCPPPGSLIGILAGASCPASDIGNVIRRLKQLAPAAKK